MAKLAEEGVCFILTGDSNTIPKFITHVLSISAEHNLDKIKLDNYHPDTTTASTTNFNYTNLKLPRLASKFTNIVKFNSVTISYAEKVALRNVSWLINQGDKWLLSGANGAGKSTLLSLINGDHPQAYANEIYLFDRKRGSGETIWDIKRNIGFISPELHWNFDGSMTCLQAVISGFYDTPSLHRGATDEQISIAQQWLEEASLIDYANQRFANVSNGIQRMLLLFRAIIKNPPLFILDEPCQGLDDYQAQQFVKLVDHLFADSQHTIIYVSHRADQIPTCISQQLNLVAGVATIIPAKNN
jgi:molybdate transport system ATP-binding protein